jgi:hypothetical protein
LGASANSFTATLGVISNTISSNLAYSPGSRIRLTSVLGLGALWAEGLLTSYTASTGDFTFTCDKLSTGSSISLTTPTISIAGEVGAIGPTSYVQNYTFSFGPLTPGTASASYYIGDYPDTNPASSINNTKGRIISLHTGTITDVAVGCIITTPGSAESSTLTIRNWTTGNSGTITTNFTTDADSIAYYAVSPQVAVTAGNTIQCVWTSPSPNWTTPPSNVRMRLNAKMVTSTSS